MAEVPEAFADVMRQQVWSAVGMNQPATNDLHVYDVQTGKDTVVTSFLGFGGSSFYVGTHGQYMVYDKSGIIDKQGTSVKACGWST